jgi:TatD DNase family protein
VALGGPAIIGGLGTGAALTGVDDRGGRSDVGAQAGSIDGTVPVLFYDLGIGLGSLTLGAFLDLVGQDFSLMYTASAAFAVVGLWYYWKRNRTMFIDAHAHLDGYGDLLGPALDEIRRLRIFTVATAMDVPTYMRLQQVGEQSELVLPTFGIHPKRAPQYTDRLAQVGRLIEATPAIGEIGLDFHWVRDSSQYPAQVKVLEYFLGAAREQNKIVNLHTKGGERQILDLLERYDVKRAIVHWYSGPLDILRALVDFGAYFTVGVELTRSQTIQEVARAIPDRLLLTETDNPGGLRWLTGVTGMPGEIVQVVEAVARLRNRSPMEIERTVHNNLVSLIGDDPGLRDVRALLSQERPLGTI